MADSQVVLSGMDESIAYLETLGAEGDRIGREAATEAAEQMRDSYLVRIISAKTGVASAVIRRNARLYRASKKYKGARIAFSSSGIPVENYRHQSRVVDARHNRSQILVDWVTGGQKVAAGFINERGKRQSPLSTHNQRRKGQKVYTYRKGQMTDAMGPSLAAAYLDLPENEVQQQAEIRLAERLSHLLDAVI